MQSFNYSNMDDASEFKKLKQSYEDVMKTFNLNGKTVDQVAGNGTYRRDVLSEALVAMADLCGKTLDLYENKNMTLCNVDDVVLKVKNAIGTDIVEKVKNVINEVVPSLVTNALKDIGTPDICSLSSQVLDNIEDKERHVIVVKEKDANTKFDEKSWSQAVKGTLQTELKKIPVNKSLLNKAGQGCLFFPNREAQAEAKLALEPLFDLTTESRPRKRVMPKIKVFDIDTDMYHDKTTLRAAIMDKNPVIAGMVENENDCSIVLIDTINKYAVLKVSPNIRKCVMDRGKIFVGMYSLKVRDHFQPLQCYACQQHGHKQGSEECKLFGKQISICLYCAGNHFSRDCTVKKDFSKHACVNCRQSSNAEQKRNASHKSTSLSCPFVIKEVNSLILCTTGINGIEAKKLKMQIR